MEKSDNSTQKRLYSLDALRGFDMFWIMGGREICIAIATLTGWPFLEWWSGQLQHARWDGFFAWDLIFPLFLFIAGVSFPFSLSKRISENKNRRNIYIHIIRRALILILIGLLYNNGIRFNVPDLRYGSVLGRIGLAWMFAAIIFMNTNLTIHIVCFWAILLGYWILHLVFIAPDLGSSDPISPEGTIVGYIDRLFMPGKLMYFDGNFDPNGILSTVPSVSTALLGMITGEFMLSKYLSDNLLKKTGILVASGVAFILLGKLWDIYFPINKLLWSSSFVCFAGGLSLLLFAIFYLIIDVWQFKKWAFFFIVIGLNPITIYLAQRVIDFKQITRFFFGGFDEILPDVWSKLISTTGYAAICWIFLYILYRKKIFLKV